MWEKNLQKENNEILNLSIEKIRLNPNQPRKSFDDDKLNELSKSIVQNGVIEPIIVRPADDNAYELVAGERRFRAAVKAGLKSIPAICKQLDNKSALEIALIENIQREDISAIECAHAYRHLMTEYNLTQEMVAERIGKQRSTIANTLRLLNLPHDIQASLEEGIITEGHARALLGVNDIRKQIEIWEKVKNQNLSVRETENLVRKSLIKREDKKSNVSRETMSYSFDANIADVEDKLKRFFGAKVTIQKNASGSGRLTIDFYDDEDLMRIIDLIS